LDVADLAALRLDLTNHGVRLDDELLAAGFGLGLAIDGRAGAAEGIDLILPDGRWANASVTPGFARTSPFLLTAANPTQLAPTDRTGFVLRHRQRGEIHVTLPDTARFRHARTHTGTSCGEIGAIHGNWLVTAPLAPNPSLALDRPRRFLGLPAQRPLTKSRWSVDEVVACAEAAWTFGGARLIHLEAGHLLADDGGLSELAPYIQALKRALPTLVSVTGLPPVADDAVLALYDAGCDAVAYHMLAWDPSAASHVSPTRARFVTRDRLLAGLRAAARYFPRGAVSTDLLVGLEPLADLDEAFTSLISEGIVPNLAVFRPLPGAEDDAPTGDMIETGPLLALMERRRALIMRHGLWHSRVRGFPRTLAGVDRYDPSWVDRSYAGLRRWLRVVRHEDDA
jgi:hypothetical protein